MGRLIVTEFLSLDGVGQAPGGPDEDREGGFPHGGWQAPVADPESGEVMFERARAMDALLLGRKTYDIFAGYWPTAPDEIPFTSLLNRAPKYVATRTLHEPLAWEGSSVIGASSLADDVAAIKERHDRVHVIGSLDLVQSLLALGLVDQLELWIYPLLLGVGKRPFSDSIAAAALQLVECVTYPSGTLQLSYDISGAPTYGDMSG